MWSFDEETGAIKNIASGTFLDFDYGWAMAAKIDKKPDAKVSAHFPKKARQWYYDPITQELNTDVEGVRTSLATLGQPRQWGALEITPSNSLLGKDNGKWRIEYCHNIFVPTQSLGNHV